MSVVPTAVVGAACRLPGEVDSLEDLWSLLVSGRNTWSPVPRERFHEAAFYHPDGDHRGTTNHRGGHFIAQHPGRFDAAFFGISQLEAKAVDPQQRIALELVYEALENAGIPIEQVRGSNTAVYASIFMHDYDRNMSKDPNNIPKYQTTGTGEAILANRVSYVFDLRGPSVTMDTGCSGGLVALHHACASLRAGECDMAVAVGVNLILGPDSMNGMSNLHMLSSDGRSFSFDDRGNGYGRGEGVVAVVLKRLADADEDRIHAIIRHSGLNQDGRTNGITMPSQAAQELLIRRTYMQAGLNTRDTHFIEAHGTGTKAGDMIELQALSNAFASRDSPLYVGSIKSNIGHTESTSGLAGLLKAILALKNGQIPPNADYLVERKDFELDNKTIEVPKEVCLWPSDRVRRASVNSFGYGGTNAHAILEFPAQQLTNGVHMSAQKFMVFSLSAKSKQSLQAAQLRLSEWIEKAAQQTNTLEDLSYTLNICRSKFQWRQSFIASTFSDLQRALRKPSAGRKCHSDPQVGFVFTGQGAQWPSMGSALLKSSPDFLASMQKSSWILCKLGCTWDLIEEIQRGPLESKINQSQIAQTASTALQVAIVDMLRALNIVPQMVVGHSSGEIAAAYCAGILTHETALQVSFYRSQICLSMNIDDTSGGAMLAVGLGEAEVQPYIKALHTGKVVVACVNSPSSVTLSGDRVAILEAATKLNAEQIFNRQLKVDLAYHSHHMRSVEHKYLKALDSMTFCRPHVRYYSSVRPDSSTESFGADYWVESLISKVRFCEAVEKLCTDFAKYSLRTESRHLLMLEIGPHGALAGPLRQTLAASFPTIEYTYSSLLTRNEDELKTTLETIGVLWESGHDLCLHGANTKLVTMQQSSFISDLPSYPWDHSQIYWHNSRSINNYLFRQDAPHDLLGTRVPTSTDLEPIWIHHLDVDTLPWLKDHIIDGLIIFPGSGYICMVIEAMRQIHNSTKTEQITSYHLKDVRFLRALTIPQSPGRVEIQLRIKPCERQNRKWHSFMICAADSDGQWHEHCRGLCLAQTSQANSMSSLQHARPARGRFSDDLSKASSHESFYTQLSECGNVYGPTFSCVRSFKSAADGAEASVVIPDISEVMPAQYMQTHVIHPATLDALLHPVLPLYIAQNGPTSIMPATIDEIVIAHYIPHEPGTEFTVVAEITPTKLRSAEANLSVFSEREENSAVPLLSVHKLDIRGVGGQGYNTSKASRPMKSFHLSWLIDVDFLTVSALSSDINVAKACTKDHGQADLITSQGPHKFALKVDFRQSALNLSSAEYLQGFVRKRPWFDVLVACEGPVLQSFLEELPENFLCAHCDAVYINASSHEMYKHQLQASAGSLLRDNSDEIGERQYDLIIALRAEDLPKLTHFLKSTGHLVSLGETMTGSTKISLAFRDFSYIQSEISTRREQAQITIYTRDHTVVSPTSSRENRATLISLGAKNKTIDYLSSSLRGRQVDHRIDVLGADTPMHGVTILVDNGSDPILARAPAQDLKAILKLVASSSLIIWVTMCDDEDTIDPRSGLIDGFSRTACAEEDYIKIVTCSLRDSLLSSVYLFSVLVSRLLHNQSSQGTLNDVESEYMIQAGQVFIRRLLPYPKIDSWLRQCGEDDTDEKLQLVPFGNLNRPMSARLDLGRPSRKIIFVEGATISGIKENNMIEIMPDFYSLTRQHSSAFLDPVAYDTAPPLNPCTGIVTAVGSEVPDIILGDRVIALGNVPLASHLVLQRDHVYRLPEGWSSDQSALSLAPYMIAYRAIVEIARTTANDYVLIEASLNNSARAAIAVARALGAQVLAVISEGQDINEFVQSVDISASNVLSPRSKQELRQWVTDSTQNRGVHLIMRVNVHPQIQTTECLRESGFIISLDNSSEEQSEISLRGITHIDLNLSVYARARPHELGALLQNTMKFLVERNSPLIASTSCFGIDEAYSALQMAKDDSQAILVQARPQAMVNLEIPRSKSVHLDPFGTYVIAGGLGDIGQRILHLIVRHGARNIVILSRRVLTEKSRNLLAKELPDGVRVESLACNIASSSSLSSASGVMESLSLPPVKGVFHCATVLHDRVMENLTLKDFNVALETKLCGTENLQRTFQTDHLTFFVMLSSLTGIVGSRGQASYASGNTFQDTLAQSASGHSTHYWSLDLGLITNTSAYRENDNRVLNLTRQGFIPCSMSMVESLIEYVISDRVGKDDPRQVIIGLDDKSITKAQNPTPIMRNAIFSNIRLASRETEASEDATYTASLAALLKNCTGTSAAAAALILPYLLSAISNLLGMREGSVATENSPAELGLDSLTAIELKNWITRETDAVVLTSEILDEKSIYALAATIADRTSLIKSSSKDDNGTETMPGYASSRMQTLPKLPLVELALTLSLYVESIRSVTSDSCFTHIKELVKSFSESDGPKLQARLQDRFQRADLKDWAYEPFTRMQYLVVRDEVRKFFGTFPSCVESQDQAHVAAVVIRAALQFKHKLETDKLEPLTMNGEPIAMDSLQWLFNAVRDPHVKQDKLRKHPASTHIAVLRRGHIFKISFSGNGTPNSLSSLKQALEEVLRASEATLPSLAALTTDNRDSWAANRQELISSGEFNAFVLNAIETAAFVVALDDETPQTSSERCTHFACSTPGSRWKDKTMQLIICANGVAGHYCDHGGLDGTTLKQLTESIQDALMRREDLKASQDGSSTCAVEHLQPILSDDILRKIDEAKRIFWESYVPMQHIRIDVSKLNGNFLRDRKIALKAAVNVCIQLAVHLYYKAPRAVWEAVSLAGFHRGRTDIMQCVQAPTRAFCDAAFGKTLDDSSIGAAELAALFRKATLFHSTNLTRHARGRGFRAHMILLLAMLREDEPVPALFREETWLQCHFRSHWIRADASDGIGSLEAGLELTDGRSLLVHYEVLDDRLDFSIQSAGYRVQEFCEHLQTAAALIRAALDG